MSNLVNGYNVTGNHGAGSERKYHVCDAAGKVLHRADGMGPAFAVAEKLPPGDIAETIPEPAPVPAVEVDEAIFGPTGT